MSESSGCQAPLSLFDTSQTRLKRDGGAWHRFFLLVFAGLTCLRPAGTRQSLQPPYPPSPVIERIEWAPASEIIRMARGADNWPLTWADDDFLYTAYGDGSGFEPLLKEKLSLGFARVGGAPPDITGENIRSASGEQKGDGASGMKASGMLMAGGVLYMWVRNAGNSRLAWSENRARDWHWCDWKLDSGFGCPTFLNFGWNYEGARDGFAYIYSHDSDSAYDAADRMVLARAPVDRLRDRGACEFFQELGNDGRPVWTKDVDRRGAVFSFPGHCYRSGISYNAGLKRYVWCQILPGEAPRFAGGFGIYDAPEPWGPWTTAYFAERWDVGPGETSSIPPKWMSSDGRTAHLVFSGDDAFSVRRMRIVLRGAAQQGGNLPSIEKIRQWDAGRDRWQKPGVPDFVPRERRSHSSQVSPKGAPLSVKPAMNEKLASRCGAG